VTHCLRRRLSVLVLTMLAVGTAACGIGADDEQADATTTSTTAAAGLTTSPEPTDPTDPAEAGPDAAQDPARVELPRPLRAAWVHLFDDSLKTAAGLETVLDDAEAGGLDAVFVQVVRRHDAYFPSEVLPPTPDPALGDLDLLGAAVEGGHRRGLQVHAWFTVATASHPVYDALELPPGHVLRDHGPGRDDPWMTVSHAGVQSRDYFDIGLPEVHDHVAAIVTDIASRYDVDGVHLDYVRYDGAQWGYHPRALARFAAETGEQGVPSPDDPAWSAWRRAQSRTIVERAREALTEARPEAVLSAAVIAQRAGPSGTPGGFAGTPAFADYQQDWPDWVAAGLLDLAIPMAYDREQVPAQARWYREWVDFAAELDASQPDVAVAVGIGAWLNTADDGAAQAREALARTAGAVLFSYQQDTSDAPRGELLRRLGDL
jgi:uncharacterized lipoprotein YddW (UPF0748 family)